MKNFIGSVSSEAIGRLFRYDHMTGFVPIYDIPDVSSIWTGLGGLQRNGKGQSYCGVCTYSGEYIEPFLMECFSYVERVDGLISLGGSWVAIDGFEGLLPCGYRLFGNSDRIWRNTFLVDGDTYGFILGLSGLRLVCGDL